MAEDQTTTPGTTGAETDAPAVPAAPAAPAIVVHGDATPEQVAALVAVLAAASGGGAPPSEEGTSTWATHAVAMRRPVDHGPGAWRTSLRP